MISQFSRTELLIKKEGVEKLSSKKVLLFGIGGVGGYCAEALARAGIGEIDLVDDDRISLTNLNRQIYALNSTIDKYKTDVAKQRMLDINPDIKVNTFKIFFAPETSFEFDFSKYDYVIDAIDTVSSKIEIIMKAKEAQVPVISSMGTGNKLDPLKFEVDDIYQTSVCPLAKVMRYELKKRNVTDLKVVYSKETPIKVDSHYDENLPYKRKIPGSISFVPAVAGLIIASEVVKDLLKIDID